MISEADSDKLVFLDESGVNTDMTRHYRRAVGKERAVDNAPENTPINTTILSLIRLNGETACTTYSGETTGDRFVEYLEKVLIPTLHEGDIVIMDNMVIPLTHQYLIAVIQRSWQGATHHMH